MKKVFLLLLTFLVWTGITHAQTQDHLPTSAVSATNQTYLVNPTDTTQRQVWNYFGNGHSSRMVTFYEFLHNLLFYPLSPIIGNAASHIGYNSAGTPVKDTVTYAKQYGSTATLPTYIKNFVDSLHALQPNLTGGNTFYGTQTFPDPGDGSLMSYSNSGFSVTTSHTGLDAFIITKSDNSQFSFINLGGYVNQDLNGYTGYGRNNLRYTYGSHYLDIYYPDISAASTNYRIDYPAANGTLALKGDTTGLNLNNTYLKKYGGNTINGDQIINGVASSTNGFQTTNSSSGDTGGGSIWPSAVSLTISNFGRNGLKILGKTGAEIASFNDLNTQADNPGIFLEQPISLNQTISNSVDTSNYVLLQRNPSLSGSHGELVKLPLSHFAVKGDTTGLNLGSIKIALLNGDNTWNGNQTLSNSNTSKAGAFVTYTNGSGYLTLSGNQLFGSGSVNLTSTAGISISGANAYGGPHIGWTDSTDPGFFFQPGDIVRGVSGGSNQYHLTFPSTYPSSNVSYLLPAGNGGTLALKGDTSSLNLGNTYQTKLTFDTQPTQNSTNPVTSGGLFQNNPVLKGYYNFKYPSQFTYRPFPIMEKDGKFYPSTTPAEYLAGRIASSPFAYVDPANGTDATTSGSYSAPYKTVAYAIGQNNVTSLVVYLMPGIYLQSNVGHQLYGTAKDVYLVALAGPEKTIFSNSPNTGITWTNASGTVYTATVSSGSGEVVDVSQKDEYGLPLRLTLANATTVLTTPNSYYISGTTATINLPHVPDANVLISQNTYNVYFNKDGGTLGIFGCTFLSTPTYTGLYVTEYTAGQAAPNSSVLLQNCRFLYGSSGISTQNQGLTWSENCIAAKTANNGFGYVKGNSTTALVAGIESNCQGFGNGIGYSGSNFNGSSAHYGVVMLRINSKYFNNQGPNVIDVGNAYNSPMTLNIGCDAANSVGYYTGVANGFNADYVVNTQLYGNGLPAPSHGYMFNYKCTSRGSTMGYISNDTSATMYNYKCVTDAPSTDPTGNVPTVAANVISGTFSISTNIATTPMVNTLNSSPTYSYLQYFGGSATAPTAAQVLVAQNNGRFQPKTMSGDATISSAGAITLANSGATSGTYKSVTVDAKGRVTSGTNPTTMSGFGITDGALAANLPVSGSATFSGTGSATSFNVTYTSPGWTPGSIVWTPTSTAAAGSYYISSITSTGFTVNYVTAPASGTNNVTAKFTLIK